jgi:hypothetical protein
LVSVRLAVWQLGKPGGFLAGDWVGVSGSKGSDALKLKKGVIGVAVPPSFSRLKAPDHRVACSVVVLGGMGVG